MSTTDMSNINSRQARLELLRRWYNYALTFYPATALPAPVHLERIAAMTGAIDFTNAPDQVQAWRDELSKLVMLADTGKGAGFDDDPTAFCGPIVSRYGILNKWRNLALKRYDESALPTDAHLRKIAHDYPDALKPGVRGRPAQVEDWVPQLKEMLALREAHKTQEINRSMDRFLTRRGTDDPAAGDDRAAVTDSGAAAPQVPYGTSRTPLISFNGNKSPKRGVAAANARGRQERTPLRPSLSGDPGAEVEASGAPGVAKYPVWTTGEKHKVAPGPFGGPQQQTPVSSDSVDRPGYRTEIPGGEDSDTESSVTGREPTSSMESADSREVPGAGDESPDTGNEALPRPEDLRDYGFNNFRSMTAMDEPQPIVGASLQRTINEDGTVRLDWSVPGDESEETGGTPVRLYRVVRDNRVLERNPEDGYLQCVTVGSAWAETEPQKGAVTMYQVWVNSGEDEQRALRAEPELVGETYVIHPVTNFSLSAVGQEITGQWEDVEPTERVAVFTCADDGHVFHRRNEICADLPNRKGFKWQTAQGGVRHRFVVARVVRIRDDSIMSDASEEKSVLVDAEVQAVDISVTEREGFDGTEFEVSWVQPSSGEVRIYRTKEEPPPEITGLESLELSGLRRTFDDQDWQNSIEGTDHGCTVGWPRDWYSIVLTPVHVDGQVCRVGDPRPFKRVGGATNIELHERVTHQLLTFGWPHGASRVTAYHQEHPDDCGGEVGEPVAIGTIDRKEYTKRGGMMLYPPLPSRGTVILEPSTVYQRKSILGERGAVAYRGCVRMSYEIHPVGQRPGLFTIGIFGERPVIGQERSFSLVVQRDRLPLEKADGVRVEVDSIHQDQSWPGQQGLFAREFARRGEQPPVYWTFNLDSVKNYPDSAFLRVFPDELQDERGQSIALDDPYIAWLNLGYLRRRAAIVGRHFRAQG
ncbi:hypothetical protein OS128_00895 [Corynebacterium sp. P5848]|uniref:hypothetical protein n=1 Tax=Corynebacterium marambiense TaxID=2765364 RepID=UPI00226088F4|nr:hypothetical protein [Corynebacterium marambiense]MCX7541477.1 hypothetical protein [Corynebacterium marambiense]